MKYEAIENFRNKSIDQAKEVRNKINLPKMDQMKSKKKQNHNPKKLRKKQNQVN